MNFDRLKKLYEEKWYTNLDIVPWQYLEISEQIWEWNNKRTWRFKWVVIKVKRKNSPDWTFTIRWKSAWITVEKIYPLSFWGFEKVTLLDKYKVRRAKLYYLRNKIWRQAKLRSLSPSNKWSNLLSK